MAGQTDVIRTSLGSRPGDSFADVIFSFTFSRVLGAIERRLDQGGLLVHVQDSMPGIHAPSRGSTRNALGSVWMDDACFFLQASVASQLASRTCVAAGVILDTCREFGLVPNLSKGKSEVILSPRGPGSQRIRAQLCGPRAPGHLHIVSEHQTDRLTIVGSYRHLGGLISHDGKLGPEIRRRLGIARQAFAHHHKNPLPQQGFVVVPAFTALSDVSIVQTLLLAGDLGLHRSARMDYFSVFGTSSLPSSSQTPS